MQQTAAESSSRTSAAPGSAVVEVNDLTMQYGDVVIMQDLNFQVRRGEIFVIMGGSGSGKSTLLKHLIGLRDPAAGTIVFDGEDFANANVETRSRILRRMGVLYQNGALWSGLTLTENIALPLEEYTSLSPETIGRVASLKLALVGLAGFGHAGGVVVGKDHRGGVVVQAALDHLPGIDRRPINGAMEEFLHGQYPVLIVQIQAGKDLALIVAQPCPQVVPGQIRTGQRVPAVQLLPQILQYTLSRTQWLIRLHH